MSVAVALLPGNSAIFSDGFTLAFREAIGYLRQKVSLPSKTWRDLEGRAHDRGFIVSGAMKEALIEDLRAAVDDAVAKGITLREFRERFEAIVAKHGWTGWIGEDSPQGRAWRARVIYDTNLRTAYAAGRWKQMTDPDMVKVRPYWMYKHGETRTPRVPRLQHVNWDDLVLRWDDPWWKTHYPPNGFSCSCGVRPVSRRELEKMGKSGPDDAPAITYINVKDSRTGEWMKVPENIELGWDHAPGRDWAAGLVPHELQKPLEPSGFVGPKRPVDLPALSDFATPVKAGLLPEGKETSFYTGEFLKAFKAEIGETKAFRDVAGHVLPISDSLFRNASGGYKVNKFIRAASFSRLAEAITDPDEIWADWSYDVGRKTVRLVRRYLRYDAKGGGLAIFEWLRDGWSGVTAFPPKPGKPGAQENYLTRHRTGALLYRRDGK